MAFTIEQDRKFIGLGQQSEAQPSTPTSPATLASEQTPAPHPDATAISLDATKRVILEKVGKLIRNTPTAETSKLNGAITHLIERLGGVETARIIDIISGLLNLDRSIYQMSLKTGIPLGNEDGQLLNVMQANVNELTKYVQRRNEKLSDELYLDLDQVLIIYKAFQIPVKDLQ